MIKISQDKPSDKKLFQVHPTARQLFTAVVSKLGINLPREIGPLDEIYIGAGQNPNVVGFTSSDPHKIYIDIDNFSNKVRNLNLQPRDVLSFFSGIQNPSNASEEIIKKINALTYIIEFASIPIHERGHNPVGSRDDEIYPEGKAQAVEANAETRMANMGLKYIKELIDKSEGVDGVKPAFDSEAGKYRSSIPQYRTAKYLNKKNIRKISKLSNNINDIKYSNELRKLAVKYDKKIKR